MSPNRGTLSIDYPRLHLHIIMWGMDVLPVLTICMTHYSANTIDKVRPIGALHRNFGG